ncbi:hypothetical protein RCL1_006374 [Eukaryota sp. TZLM3-RCL]
MLFFSKKTIQFHCSLTVNSFNEVPLAEDFVFFELKPPKSVSRSPIVSPIVPIRSGSANFDEIFTWKLDLRVNSTTLMLESSLLRISVKQRVGRSSHVLLGFSEVDLAQFAGEQNTSFIVPVQECRFLGNLRLTVSMLPISSLMTFKTPPFSQNVSIVGPIPQDLNSNESKSPIHSLFSSPISSFYGTPNTSNFVDQFLSDL